MDKKFIKDAVGWGVILWLIGYILGFVAFMIVPADKIGWVVMPIGVLITIWVLARKINLNAPVYYLKIAVVWTVIAILFDYLFLVKLLNPADGYYKLDVYLYYILTFVMPLIAGILKFKKAGGAMPGLAEKLAKEKAQNRQKVLDFIAGRDKVTNNDIQKLLGVSDATAERYLNELEKQGVLRQVGERGGYVYYKHLK